MPMKAALVAAFLLASIVTAAGCAGDGGAQRHRLPPQGGSCDAINGVYADAGKVLEESYPLHERVAPSLFRLLSHRLLPKGASGVAISGVRRGDGIDVQLAPFPSSGNGVHRHAITGRCTAGVLELDIDDTGHAEGVLAHRTRRTRLWRVSDGTLVLERQLKQKGVILLIIPFFSTTTDIYRFEQAD